MLKQRRFGIKTKLIFIYFLIAVPLVILLSISLYARYQSSQQAALDERLEIARLSSSNFTLFVEQISISEEHIGATIVDQQLGVDSMNALLSRAVERYPASNLAFLSNNGVVIAASVAETIGQNRSNRPVIREILDGKDMSIGNLQHNTDGRPGFVIATGIRRAGQLAGIVSMSIAADQLNEVLDIAVRTGGVNIVDASGHLIFQSQAPAIPFDERDWSDEQFVQAALAGNTYTSTGLLFPLDNSLRMGVEIPIQDIGWATGSFVPVESVLGPIRRAAVLNAFIALLILGIALSSAFILGNNIARNLITLRDHMRTAPHIEFTERVIIPTGDEIENLADSFNRMQDEIINAQAAQRKLQEELQQRNEELSALYEKQRDIALTLQQSLLSEIKQKLTHLEVGSSFQSATEAALVGGDFFDFFEIPERRYGIVMGDVSGKGIEAASLATMVRNTLRAFAYSGESPAMVIEKVNNIAVIETPPSVFITLFLGIINADSHDMTYANAGHWPPLIYKPGEDEFEILQTGGLPLGAFPGAKYEELSTSLTIKSIMALFTDGVIESRKDKKFFGVAGVQQTIKNSHNLSPSEISKAIINNAKDFGGGRLNDDAAAMVVKAI